MIESRSDERTKGVGWSVAEWLMGIIGGIGVFLGLFVMFAGDDQSIGLGGDFSWTVGEVSDAWMYGLLIGGGVLLLAALSMVVMGRSRASVASSPLSELLLHAGVFLAVNAFIWAQDFALGDGLNYALWITIPWGVGLLIHAGLYMANRRAVALPAETVERPKELQHH